jgi:hypothetical protein
VHPIGLSHTFHYKQAAMLQYRTTGFFALFMFKAKLPLSTQTNRCDRTISL